MNNQKGVSNIAIVGILALVVLAGVWYITKMKSGEDYYENDSMEMMENESSANEYEQMPEDETTPDEINNESLDELDQIMQDLDENTITEEEIQSL